MYLKFFLDTIIADLKPYRTFLVDHTTKIYKGLILAAIRDAFFLDIFIVDFGGFIFYCYFDICVVLKPCAVNKCHSLPAVPPSNKSELLKPRRLTGRARCLLWSSDLYDDLMLVRFTYLTFS